jgi:hypothetical protein
MAVSVIIGAVGALFRISVWVGSTLRKLGRLADDLMGEPGRPGHPDPTPGLLDRVATIEGHVAPLRNRLDDLDRRLAAVEAELQPNGGSTLRDAVNRIPPNDL